MAERKLHCLSAEILRIMKTPYNTLSEAVDALTKKGYTKDFSLKSDCVYCVADDLTLSPKDFQIDKIYRFEGMTDPGDSTILYALSATDGSVKGTMVDAYGADADPLKTEMLSKLQALG